LKLKYDEALSNFAFNCNLRRYNWDHIDRIPWLDLLGEAIQSADAGAGEVGTHGTATHAIATSPTTCQTLVS
jgi:hypothetical protein